MTHYRFETEKRKMKEKLIAQQRSSVIDEFYIQPEVLIKWKVSMSSTNGGKVRKPQIYFNAAVRFGIADVYTTANSWDGWLLSLARSFFLVFLL
jgi:hypothetical protein